jgi:hypothetical protein
MHAWVGRGRGGSYILTHHTYNHTARLMSWLNARPWCTSADPPLPMLLPMLDARLQLRQVTTCQSAKGSCSAWPGGWVGEMQASHSGRCYQCPNVVI